MPSPCFHVIQAASNIAVKPLQNAARRWFHVRVNYKTQNASLHHAPKLHRTSSVTLNVNSSCSQAPQVAPGKTFSTHQSLILKKFADDAFISKNTLFNVKFLLYPLTSLALASLSIGGIAAFAIGEIGNASQDHKIYQQPGQPDKTYPALFDPPLTSVVPDTSVPKPVTDVSIGFPSLQVTSQQIPTTVPEPTSSTLLSLGAVAAWAIRQGRRRPLPSPFSCTGQRVAETPTMARQAKPV